MEDLAFFGGSRVVDSTGAQPHNPWAYTDLEDALKRHLGVRYVLLVNSGTSAITAALQAAGVGPGDEVLTAAHSWIAHVAAIFNCNAIPVFADVDRQTYNIDVDDVARKITPQTKAILPVDLYGLPADIPALVELADRHNIRVVEDACQAGGAEIDGRKLGSIAHLTAFSFSGKPISGWGGGFLATNDHELYQRAILAGQMSTLVSNSVTDPSLQPQRDFPGRGQNMRMLTQKPEAILHDMDSVDPRIDARIANCEYLNERFSEIPGIIPPFTPAGYRHVYHIYTAVLDVAEVGFSRNLFLRALAAEGIPATAYVSHLSNHYWNENGPTPGFRHVDSGPIHWRNVFQNLDYHGKGCPWTCGHAVRTPDYSKGSLPVTEWLNQREFCFRQPMLSYPNGKEEMQAIVDGVKKVIDHAEQLQRYESAQLVPAT